MIQLIHIKPYELFYRNGNTKKLPLSLQNVTAANKDDLISYL